MIKVYSLNLDEEFNKENLESVSTLLSPDTLQRAKGFRFFKDAAYCALGELLVKYALEDVFGVLSQNLSFSLGEYGKPYIKDCKDMHFNLAHSGKRIVCAVSSEPVGIDIEKVTKVDALNVSREYFSMEEYELISNSPEGVRNSLFFEFWTAKESYIKLTGKGLHLPLNSFSIKFNTVPAEVLCLQNGNQLAFVKQYELEAGYKLSVCSSKGKFEDDIVLLSYSPSSLNISSLCSPSDGGALTSLSAIFSR